MIKNILPPKATKKPHSSLHHGLKRDDPYAWLRAENWQEVMRKPDVLDHEIRAYLEAENEYTHAQMADTEALRATLFGEMKGRIKEDDSSVPNADGKWAYAVRYIKDGQYPLIVREPRGGGEQTTLLDGNILAKDKAYFQLGGTDHSPDHRYLAWGFDDRGSEYYTLRIRDMSNGLDRDENIIETTGHAIWANDGKTFFYVWLDANHRPSKVYRHVLGTSQADDELVYEEKDAGFFVGLGKTQSGRFIIIHSHDHETSEIRLIDADEPTSRPWLIAERQTGEEYDVEHHGERLFILTNAKGAEDFKIITAPLDAPDRKHWDDFIAHEKGCLILSFVVFEDFLVRLERIDGLPRIVIHRFHDGSEHAIAFNEEAYALGMSAGYEFKTNNLRFNYSSMTTPTEIYDYDMVEQSRILRKQQEVPSGHEPQNYVTRRIFAPADDGEMVPVTLFYHKDTPLDGTAPCLLYGYGAYGVTIPASFSISTLSLVDRGFIYAVAHIRGGMDKGYHWYADGRREKKINTFKDFITAAKMLSAETYTSKGRIIAHGGSAGGMLMGAVANMAPELFSGIIAEVPFVDVLTTMLDDTLPLTPPEWPEWGNPIADKDAYLTIAAYSPYDNVVAQAYPAILAVGGLTDPRVTYWEPAKWVAKLRDTKTSDSLLLLKTNMKAGHGGAPGRFERLEEVAFNWAFALKMVGK